MPKDSKGVRAASASSIAIDFYYRGVRCREFVRMEPTARNLKFCEKWKARIEHEISLGTFQYAAHFPNSPRVDKFRTVRGGDMLIKDALESWMAANQGRFKSSTAATYRQFIRAELTPAFGHLRLDEIRRSHVRAWADHIAARRRSWRLIVAPLRHVMAEAAADEIIPTNPLLGWVPPTTTRLEYKAKTIDPFSALERDAILRALTGQARNLIGFAFWSGLRISELVALDWENVDLLGGYIHVVKAKTRYAKVAERPKTAAGERKVKILQPARQYLIDQKAYTYIKGLEVFQSPLLLDRLPSDHHIVKRIWHPALRRSGVRYRKLYNTRHTYASMLLSAGEDVAWISRQLGHSNWAFTARTYATFIDADRPDVGSKAESMFGGIEPESLAR